jgi:two-component system, cell cycle response regulator
MSAWTTRPIEVLLVDDAPGGMSAVEAALADTPFVLSHVAALPGPGESLGRRMVDLVLLALPPASATSPRQLWLDVPVLAILDDKDDDSELRAMEEGALDWVTRAEIRPEILPRAIRYVLDRHRLESELVRMAHIDPLTGLHNRRYLMKQLDVAVASSRRHGHPLTVSVCDIDRFKAVNDEYGHLVGDEVLRAFAGIVSQQLRREDQVARFGGDEFCLMFPHVTPDEAARAIERIRAALEDYELRTPDGSILSVTATFGLAQLTAEHRDGQHLFDSADRALYEGKAGGRNRVSTSPQ